MKQPLAAAAALLIASGNSAFAHRLDEYLQAAVISVERTRVHVELRLTPGVAVFPYILREIDSNGDQTISADEQRAYADRVLREISLTTDGERATPRLLATNFPTLDEMRAGRGEIQLEFDAPLRSAGSHRSLTFENRHLSRISAYLVNALVPRDPDIRITAQDRNYSQSVYRLDYVDSRAPSARGAWASLGALCFLLFARVAFLRLQRPARF